MTASIGYQLRANVDNLTYVGTSVASLVGNELNNFIDASSTSARVVANGGAGNDQVHARRQWRRHPHRRRRQRQADRQ